MIHFSRLKIRVHLAKDSFTFPNTVEPRLIRTPRGHAIMSVLSGCPYYPGVRIKRALRENVRDTCFIDIKTKADEKTLFNFLFFLTVTVTSSS